MQISLFKKMMDPHYYTASVDSNSMSGQVSHQVVRSSSLRQVMRFAARFNADQPPEAEISVYRHANGHDPKLVAKRLVAAALSGRAPVTFLSIALAFALLWSTLGLFIYGVLRQRERRH
jgi:hypothetical protein